MSKTDNPNLTKEGREAARSAVLYELAKRDLSPRTFAREASIAPGTALDFIKGTRWPIGQTLRKIEDYLGWSEGDLDLMAAGLIPAPVAPTAAPVIADADGVLLDVGREEFGDLTDQEFSEAITAAKLTLLERAREIRRARG